MKYLIAAIIIILPILSFAGNHSFDYGKAMGVGATSICHQKIAKEVIITGPLVVKKSKIFKLQSMGPVKAKDLQSKHVKITGPLTAKNLTIQKLEVTGPVKINTATIQDLKITGTVHFNKADIQSANITGSFKAHSSKIKLLKIQGSVKINDHSDIQQLDAIGNVDIRDSKIGDINLTSEECIIHNSTINNIRFAKNTQRNNPPILKLSDTKINGKITFESKNGIVMLNKNLIKYFDPSKIIGGQIQPLE